MKKAILRCDGKLHEYEATIREEQNICECCGTVLGISEVESGQPEFHIGPLTVKEKYSGRVIYHCETCNNYPIFVSTVVVKDYGER